VQGHNVLNFQVVNSQTKAKLLECEITQITQSYSSVLMARKSSKYLQISSLYKEKHSFSICQSLLGSTSSRS
jgi:hypothetical protein